MFKKILTGAAAGAMAVGAMVGVAAPANASGLDDSLNVVNKADKPGALVGNIGLQVGTGYSTSNYTLPPNGGYMGPKQNGNQYFYPITVRAGNGYCVWEELYSRPTTSTGSHTTFEGNFNYGKSAPNTWYFLEGYKRVSGSLGPDYTNKDYWSTLRIYSC